MPCSPGSRTFLLASLAPRIDDAVRPVGLARIFDRLDRSNDGQDHTVLPYAAHPASPRGFAGLRRRSSARSPRAHRDYPPCPHPLVPTLPRPPQPGPRFERLANRPSSSGRAGSIYAANPNFGKVEYFCGEGLTRRRHSGVISCRMGRAQRNPSCFHERRTMMGFAALYPSYKLRPFNSAPRIVHRRHIPTDRRPNPAGRYRAPRGGERTMAPNRGPD